MSTIFSKIISGEIPCYKIAENDQFLAFLDILPLSKGHTLIIPKQQIDYFFDLDNDLLAEYNIFAKEIARKIKAVVPCIKIGVAVIGLEVPHAHMHLVPMNHIGDLNFTKERVKLTPEEFTELADQIRNA
ncbi:MAG: HIT family protein [Flavobacteriales bacterium]|jgi:histidine triad (HIT) family protein